MSTRIIDGEKVTLKVNDNCDNLRIDLYISRHTDYSRSTIKNLLESGEVAVNGSPCKASYRPKIGDEIMIFPPQPKPVNAVAQEIPLEIVYEDDYLLVVDKPCGMVVHPAAGHGEGTLVNALLAHCNGGLSRVNGDIRPGIIHRIDKETSGLLIVAKDDISHAHLARQVAAHTAERRYIAVVHGNVQNDNGVVSLPVGRHKTDRKRMAVVPNGKEAVTHYSVLQRFHKYTYVECRLETGRTHQIRVHMSHLKHPVVGDLIYGVRKETLRVENQLLHARAIAFTHPRTEQRMTFETDVPYRFTKVLETLSHSI